MAQIFEDFKIGEVTARNRLVRAATAESLCTREGAPSKRMVDYYGELARGGVGTIITGYAYVAADGKPSERALNLSDDALLDDLRALAEGVHSQVIIDGEVEPVATVMLPKLGADGRVLAGEPAVARTAMAPAAASDSVQDKQGTRALVFAQLVYGGSKSKLDAADPRYLPVAPTDESDQAAPEPFAPAAPNVDIVGPSAVAHPATGLVPRAATVEDLKRIVSAFAQAAARAKRAGFDGVEIHAGHGYLLSQFLDGRFNKREDEYGGAIENRARLLLECVCAVRAEVGESFPVLVKLNSCDVMGDVAGTTGGLSETDSLQVAQWAVDAGATGIEVSGDWHGVEQEDVTGEPFFGSYGTRLAARLGDAAPVIVTGGWRDPDTITRYLETTGIAGVGMSRPLICQSILPELWRSGMDHAAECISCDWCLGKNGIPCLLRRGRG